MTITVNVPLGKIGEGDYLWITREDVEALEVWGFSFTVDEYDGDYCRVEIHGHTDGEA